jgi:hypothetical protein
MIWHELRLPVFKQGDDIAHSISSAGSVRDGLLDQAGNYTAAAATLIRIAACKRLDELTITGNTHTIDVEGPEDLLEELVEQGLIVKCDDEDGAV